MIKPCDGARCDSEFQDKLYGNGMRVKNPCKDGSLRCTVCAKQGSAPSKVTTGKK